ncbi:protein UL138 [Human betaherpesvirus 5]|uniref:Protein UL138 n=1 Tax=Human cytomegalovirus TaxID=10359 RepID=A0A126NAU1_HCMV|nr:protein UL138 [Human betaherpesvirus 5]AQN72604.1 protein UL138 [Human betaherpesvirus 5]
MDDLPLNVGLPIIGVMLVLIVAILCYLAYHWHDTFKLVRMFLSYRWLIRCCELYGEYERRFADLSSLGLGAVRRESDRRYRFSERPDEILVRWEEVSSQCSYASSRITDRRMGSSSSSSVHVANQRNSVPPPDMAVTAPLTDVDLLKPVTGSATQFTTVAMVHYHQEYT